MGRIAIEGMKFYAYHGYYREERRIGNNFSVDIYIDTPLLKAGSSDDLEDTVNYEKLWEMTREVMNEPAYLIEKVAKDIYQRIANRFGTIRYCKVRVTKLNPPIPGEVDRTYVEFDSNDAA